MKSHATPSQKAAIVRLLDKVLLPPREDGIIAYAEGWSDRRVSEEVGCSIISVSGFRLASYGKLQLKPRKELDLRGHEEIDSLRNEIRELRSRLRYLEQSLGVDGPDA